MRRLLVVASVALAAVAAAPAGAASEGTVAVPWSLVDTGPGARSLVIRYERGGCDGPITAHATGTARAIRIHVARAETIGGPPRACPQYVAILTATVKLRHPVGGRRILGGTRADPLPGPVGSGGAGVPRVLGLAPGDARAVLRAAGLTVTTRARERTVRLPQVIRQSPRAHAPAPASGAVRLLVSGTSRG